MIKAIIIDDEQHAIESLKYELSQNCPEVTMIGESTDAKNAIQLVNELKPNLLFLDIEMPWMSGFELLQKIDEISFEVIFVTAYDRYAIKAFKFSAIDYLLKPVNGKELKKAVSKVVSKKSDFNQNHLQALIQNLTQKEETLEKIVLPTVDGLEFVQVDQILRCESDSNYCRIILANGRSIYLAKTLKEIESLLVDHAFHRVHNSHLIAEQYILKYSNAEGGHIEMNNGDLIPISRSKKNEFLNLFK